MNYDMQITKLNCDGSFYRKVIISHNNYISNSIKIDDQQYHILDISPFNFKLITDIVGEYDIYFTQNHSLNKIAFVIQFKIDSATEYEIHSYEIQIIGLSDQYFIVIINTGLGGKYKNIFYLCDKISGIQNLFDNFVKIFR